MKKILAFILALSVAFSFSACNNAKIKDTADRGQVKVFLDGKEVGTVSVDNFQKKTEEKKIGDDIYYGKLLSAAVDGVDFGTVKSVFSKSADGYAAFFANPADIFLATYKADENGELKSIQSKDGKDNFTAVTEKTKAKAVSEIYLLTREVNFKSTFKIDGKETVLTIDDFMALKPEFKKLSHFYDGGAATFEGEFLCVDTKTLYESLGLTMTSAKNDEGIEVYYAEGKNIAVTGGVQSSSSALEIKLNKDLKSDPLHEKSAWLCYYFVLVNGSNYHEIAGAEIGLSCMIDGTGMRWMATPVDTVEITNAEAE